MSDAVPKSRVTLTYDTKQPEGREKPRELPFRLMVLGDVGGEKAKFNGTTPVSEWEAIPIDERKVRQLNGRNLGEAMKGLKIKVRGVPLGFELPDNTEATTDVLIDSMSCFAPNDVLKLLTGQKSTDTVPSLLAQVWHGELKSAGSNGGTTVAQQLWPGQPYLEFRWARREGLVGFQKSYQNSKKLRDALKALSVPLDRAADTEDADVKAKIDEARAAWEAAIAAMKQNIEAELAAKHVELPKAPRAASADAAAAPASEEAQ